MDSRIKDIELDTSGNSKGIPVPKKLSWDETFQEMACENEKWDDFDVTLLDGMDENS